MKSNIKEEYLKNHFRFHNRLTVYQGDITITITKAWHLHFSGGHHEFDIEDCEDLAELFSKRGVTLEPVIK